MAKETFLEQLEKLGDFLEEHGAELVNRGVLSRKRSKELDQHIMDYFTADSADDVFCTSMCRSEIFYLLDKIEKKIDKRSETSPGLMNDKLTGQFYRLVVETLSMDIMDGQEEDSGEDVLPDFDSLIHQIAEGMKGEKLTDDEKERLGAAFADPETLSQWMSDFSMEHYHYHCPDYAGFLQDGEVDTPLSGLLPHQLAETENFDYDRLVSSLEDWQHEKTAAQLTRLVYSHLKAWQDNPCPDTDGLLLTLALIEHFQVSECLPAVLEMLRQDYDFMQMYFGDICLEDVPAAVLSNIVEADQLPVLLDFMKEPGLLPESKSQVALAVGQLPKRDGRMLLQVQRWLADVLNYYYPKGEDSDLFDGIVLDKLFYCCIHARAVALEPLIAKFYSAYMIPPSMVVDGMDGVKEDIRDGELGTLEEESGERMILDVLSYGDDDSDACRNPDGEDELDDEDWDGGPFDLSDYDFQDYEGWAENPAAVYMPSVDVKKYTLRIKLDHIRPAIWRKIEVPSNITLASLASVILLSMGWCETHLHQFVAKRGKAVDLYVTSIHNPKGFQAVAGRYHDGGRVTVGEILKKVKDKVTFEYDYGDGWEHTVTLTGIADYAGSEKQVTLLDGKRACPPEDCGGVWGYQEICELMKDPASQDARERLEWLGYRFDPERFQLEKAQRAVRGCNR
ncbi:MAG: plasmid pRiA4b ORF-3 family protein [Prevotella multiformis]|uniref:plasmid pRiA4b ORF-3 family protein n=1 Tax=Prevotella multiformis TaxID=282402 RepID=UPI003FA07A07